MMCYGGPLDGLVVSSSLIKSARVALPMAKERHPYNDEWSVWCIATGRAIATAHYEVDNGRLVYCSTRIGAK